MLTATWVMVFAIALRYGQRAIVIERQYDYLHSLEEHIASRLDQAEVFQREGKALLRGYPAFSDWTWISYVVIFPIVAIGAVAGVVILEFARMDYPVVPDGSGNRLGSRPSLRLTAGQGECDRSWPGNGSCRSGGRYGPVEDIPVLLRVPRTAPRM